MSSSPVDPFYNVHDHQVYGSPPIPATWDGTVDESVVVSLWWDDPIHPDAVPPVGIGIALVVEDDIKSVGFTPTEARQLIERLTTAVNIVDPIEE